MPVINHYDSQSVKQTITVSFSGSKGVPSLLTTNPNALNKRSQGTGVIRTRDMLQRILSKF